LNLGAGPIQPEEWVNVDNSNRAKLASRLPWLDQALVWCRILPPTEFGRRTQTCDIRKRLPFSDNSVSAIYGGEVLEHLTCEQGQRLLRECYRVLQPGGVLRLRVPDNYRFWRNYVQECDRVRELPRAQWHEEHTRWVQMFFRDICVRRPWLGSMGHFHKWMYDEVSLILAFERAGFVQVERRGLHDSRIAQVEQVEVREDLNVEGVKPGPQGAVS
jgi:predicted SAM-dependent methyltransferase